MSENYTLAMAGVNALAAIICFKEEWQTFGWINLVCSAYNAARFVDMIT